MIITLTLTTGEKQTQSFAASEVTIGRGQKADFIVRDDSLSRLHAKIELINHQFFITDLESSNGVFLDGKRLVVNQKTPFSTFLVLQLGPVECLVSDSSDNSAVNYAQPMKSSLQADAADELSKITKAARNINRNALNSSSPVSKKETKSGNQFPLIAAVVLGLFGFVAYLQLKPDETAEVTAPLETAPAPVAPTQAPVAEPVQVEAAPKIIKNDFYTQEEYEAISLKKSCKQHFDICHAMEISEDEREGIYLEDKEAFVFMNAGRKVKNFSGLVGKTDAAELIALSTFLSSSLYTSFKNKELEQVHILLLNEEFKIAKVHRLNAADYVESEQITKGISDALFTGNSTPFWQAFSSQNRSKTF